jgi:hypothetical protein
VLFYISNFQFLVTTIAFNTSEPFKKPIYANYLYLGSIIVLFLADISLLIVSPDNSIYWWLFHDESFAFNDNVYKGYYWVIVSGIVINSIVTFATEMLVSRCFAQNNNNKQINDSKSQN